MPLSRRAKIGAIIGTAVAGGATAVYYFRGQIFYGLPIINGKPTNLDTVITNPPQPELVQWFANSFREHVSPYVTVDWVQTNLEKLALGSVKVKEAIIALSSMLEEVPTLQ